MGAFSKVVWRVLSVVSGCLASIVVSPNRSARTASGSRPGACASHGEDNALHF
jgi:hypothetical protein